MRGDPDRTPRGPWALKGILIALAAIFILQNILTHWVGSTSLEEYLALSMKGLKSGWLHTLLTYGFLHSTAQPLPWHLILNGFMLYWFGREFEARAGSYHFLECFLFSILSGGILWSIVHLFGGHSSAVIGASAGVFGVLALFCRYRWLDSMVLMFIPIRFTGQQLFWALIGIQGFLMLFSEIPGNFSNATAYSAHLGGILGAVLYEKVRLHKTPFLLRFSTSSRPSRSKPAWQKRADATRGTTNRFSVNLSKPNHLKAEVDRILDKINDKGFGALTAEEKQILEKARNKL